MKSAIRKVSSGYGTYLQSLGEGECHILLGVDPPFLWQKTYSRVHSRWKCKKTGLPQFLHNIDTFHAHPFMRHTYLCAQHITATMTGTERTPNSFRFFNPNIPYYILLRNRVKKTEVVRVSGINQRVVTGYSISSPLIRSRCRLL